MSNDRFKFRVWDNVRKKYDRIGSLLLCQYGAVCCTNTEGIATYPDAGEDYIIEQCTGLRDKNGKLIYEGDKLRHDTTIYSPFGSITDGYVVYDELGFCFDYTKKHFPGERRSLSVMNREDASFSQSIEIVGNIHEVKK